MLANADRNLDEALHQGLVEGGRAMSRIGEYDGSISVRRNLAVVVPLIFPGISLEILAACDTNYYVVTK